MKDPNVRYILNESGEPELCEDLLTWGRWYERCDRHVDATTVGDLWVSTVFLGIDHDFSGLGPPILWETLTFRLDPEDHSRLIMGGSDDTGQSARYSSKADALKGHARAVAVAQRIVQERGAPRTR